MKPVDIMTNNWVEKEYKKPTMMTKDDYLAQDSTPHVVKRNGAKDIAISYHRANRIKTLRGLRRL